MTVVLDILTTKRHRYRLAKEGVRILSKLKLVLEITFKDRKKKTKQIKQVVKHKWRLNHVQFADNVLLTSEPLTELQETLANLNRECFNVSLTL